VPLLWPNSLLSPISLLISQDSTSEIFPSMQSKTDIILWLLVALFCAVLCTRGIIGVERFFDVLCFQQRLSSEYFPLSSLNWHLDYSTCRDLYACDILVHVNSLTPASVNHNGSPAWHMLLTSVRDTAKSPPMWIQLHVKINANNYLLNAENSIICSLPNML
jgi:hypothetical protein